MYDIPATAAFQYVWSMGIFAVNAVETATGSAEREKLDNSEDSENSYNCDSGGDEVSGSDEEDRDEGINGYVSEDDMKDQRVNSGSLPEE